jgi:bacteriorhodopsin
VVGLANVGTGDHDLTEIFVNTNMESDLSTISYSRYLRLALGLPLVLISFRVFVGPKILKKYGLTPLGTRVPATGVRNVKLDNHDTDDFVFELYIKVFPLIRLSA